MMDPVKLTKFRNDFVTIVGPNFPVLYHGTKDLEFAIGIAQKAGFHSEQAFRAKYCQNGLGGTAIYGPGIYLTDSLKEAKSYGCHILEFRFHQSADYLDVFNPAISKAAVKSAGGGKQTILSEINLSVLLRVTQNYYVLRSPYLVSPSMNG
ncbi:MAG TPA: hypothetical protein VFM46_12325 [Pseudomonadales bacterium]|nr:hypothetical protein [Pseudomonadales bacterium]